MKSFLGDWGERGLGLPLGSLLGVFLFLLKTALICGLAFASARLVWLVLAGPGQEVAISVASQSSNTQDKVIADPAIFREIDLFGVRKSDAEDSDAQNQSRPEIASAPTTNLKLVLHGVRNTTGEGDGDGVAIISNEKGPQKNYRLGDEIDGLQGVKIDRIYSDGVLIVRNGKVESLLISDPDVKALVVVVEEGETPSPATEDRTPIIETAPERQSDDAEPVAASAPAPPKLEQKSPPIRVDLTEAEMLQLFQSVSFDATGLEEGMYIFPVRNSALFRRAQLRARDIVLSVGGARINRNTDFQRLLQDLEGDDQTDVQIQRGDELIVVTLRRVG